MRKALLLLAAAAAVTAQECGNYGVLSGSSCACPPGFGGSESDNCNLATCGGSLYEPTGVGSGTYGNVSACECASGWDGLSCTVCESADACTQSLTSYLSHNSVMVPGLNASLVCNSNPIVYSASHMTCDVVQVLLQSLFPGTTKLSISRFLNGSLTPGGINGLASAGIANGEGEIWAQLWYNGVEQFYCHASECTQEVVSETSSSDWNCPQLSCTCRPGTSFCGGGTTATQNLTSAIDGLGGPLEVSCTPDGTCSFKQQFLTIFGNSGLPLSGCRFGECVNQYVIDQALGISEAKTGDNGLSGGVIAGLAVVGAIVLLIILAIVWGLIARAKARKAAPDASLFKKSGAGMAWHDIGYEVKGHGRGMYQATMAWLRGTGAPARAGTPQSENGTMVTSTGGRVVLHDVGGELPPGAFACILGPSGAGKSTLVDILAGRRKAGKVVGKVSYTTETPGRPVKIGYCDQSDVLNPTSTVIETLRFAAFLRLPENIPADVKEARAQTVLTQLGLAGIANTRVGSGETRGISGGEMRRVSIGIELVANPDILILDEPTSGLDSVSAARVINLLKSLTTDPENRTTIVASVHQPSSALYHAFSQVILLSAGRQLYFGPGGSAPADYFTAQGRPCPVGYNIADHLLELASEPDGLHSGSTASPTRSPRSGTPSKSTSDEKNPEVDLAELYEQEQTAHWWPKSHCATTFLTQFEVLAGREWRNLCRDKFLFPTHFLLAVIIGLFGGGCFFQTGQTIGGFQNRVGGLFFLGSLISFQSLSALYSVLEGRGLFLRERSSNFYTPQTWIVSRVVFDIIPLRIIPTLVLSIIVYFMIGTIGIDANAATFFKYLLVAFLFTIVMVLYNFLLAAVITHGGIAVLLSSLWNLLNFVYAGFFVNTKQMPAVLRWIKYIVPLNYALEALTVNWINFTIEDVLSSVPISINAVAIMETLFGFDVSHYYRNVLILFGFIAGFGLMLIGSVIWFMRERR